MANTILHKRSSTGSSVPTAGQMTLGELALNTTDGRVYMKTPTGVVEVSYRDSRVRAAISTSGWSNLSYNNTTGVISISAPSTSDITEGTNKYYTDARVKDYLGSGGFTGSIIPATDNVYSLGSPSKMWKDVFVGPGSLYINGQKVLEESSGNIVVSADINQNLVLATTGDGNVELDPQGTGSILLKGPVQVQAGSSVISSDGNAIQFGNQVAVDSITSKSTNTDLTLTAAGTGKVLVNDSLTVANNLIVSGNLTINGTTTTINATTLSIADNIIDLNSNVTGSPTSNAGIRIVRGDESATQLRWNETTDAWQYTADGAAYFDIVGATATQTLTNKTIAANSNTISGLTNANFNGTAGITNANLANSTVTVGSTAINLGSTATSIAGLTSVTATTFTGNLVGNVTGTITGGITGNAATATALATSRTIALTGDATASGSFDGSANYSQALTLATVNSTVGSFGSATAIPVVTVNAKGLVTSVTTTAVSIPSGALTFTGDVTGTGTTGSSTALTIKTSPTLTTPILSGTTTVSGNLVPSADLTYDLGSVSSRFRNLYLSGSTIAISGATSGTLTIAAPSVAGTTTVTFPATTGTVITTGDTGSVTNTMLAGSIATSKITGLATSATTDTTSATNITSGTLPSARLSGSYTGITAVGTLTAGSVPASLITGLSSSATTDTSNASNIASGTLANARTTATNLNTASAIVARDASGNFTAGTITAALTGNASTATTLQTARTINGVSFDGSASISFGTGSVTEGANLYFTDARAVSANTSAIATAKSEAISTASADATSKANAAQAAAIAAVTNGAGAAFDTLKEIQDLMATDSELSSAIAAISNVPSATKLQTARTIQGVSFDGTSAITVVTAGTGISVSGTAVTNTGILSITGTAPVSASTTSGATTISMAAATSAVNGYMTSTYAAKLDGIAAGATNVTNTNQLTNGAGYITGITSGNVTTALGFTPYNATNPSGYYSSGSTPSFGATSTGALTVTGAITATGDMTAYYSSDRNLKTNIAPITGALAKVEAISGVTYNWNETAVGQGKSADVREAGVIAQEVQAVLPEVVKTRDNGFLAVDYEKMVALLIEAVKELSAEVKDLKAQLNK